MDHYQGMPMPHGFPPPQMQGGMGDGAGMMNQPPPGAMMNPQIMPDHFNQNVSLCYCVHFIRLIKLENVLLPSVISKLPVNDTIDVYGTVVEINLGPVQCILG